MAAISQTTLSNAYSWMKTSEFRLRFHWSLFLRFQLLISQLWFRWWLGADQATSHYLNQCWLVCWRIYASLGLKELTTFCCYVVLTHSLKLKRSDSVIHPVEVRSYVTAIDGHDSGSIIISKLICRLIQSNLASEANLSSNTLKPSYSNTLVKQGFA